jgi:uncharacterized RDD family membrane protein YckC
MKPSEVPVESNSASRHFDPEIADASEQEFAASLEQSIEKPRFVVDDPYAETTRVAGAEPSGDPEAPNSPPSDASADPVASRRESLDEPFSPENQPSSSGWREQVSAKVSKYKSRSRHKPRYPSLQLPFEPGRNRARQEPSESSTPPSFSQSVRAEIVALQPAPVREPELPRITLDATARVIEFPRTSPPVIDPNQLAEPILDRPRIVEAPELLPPPPAMGGILIEVPREVEPERRPGFDLPLKSSSITQRWWAGTIDALLVAIAVAAFGYIFIRMTFAIPPWRTCALSVAALLALLWPAYQYAFLVFSETTPGLWLARLQIQRFDGTPAPRNLRRWRVLASILSAVPLGLGYAWCFLDEDQLSWHDRITCTHLAPQGRGAH